MQALSSEKLNSEIIQITSHSIVVNYTAEKIWQVWSDVTSWSSWDPDLQESKLISEDGFCLGAKIKLVHRSNPEPITVNIVSLKEKESFSAESNQELGKVILAHNLSSDQGSTQITHTYFFEPKNSETKSIFENIVAPILKINCAKALKGLAHYCQKCY